MGQKLYVGNLPFDATELDIEQHFSQAGGVREVMIVKDSATGRARGFGFVEMDSNSDAQTAISKFNEQDFGGRTLTVNEARPRAPRPSGGYGGGRGPGGGGGRGPKREPRW